jgi:thioredoxin-like negative regulator of GroEL
LIERLLIALALALLGWLAYAGLLRWILRNRHRRTLGLPQFTAGRPAILLFTTPDCVPCRTIQRPAIENVVEKYEGRLQFIQVDAYDKAPLAAAWGVLSVPTTFIIDAHGRPRGVNMGVARQTQLISQLEAIGEYSRDATRETGLVAGD